MIPDVQPCNAIVSGPLAAAQESIRGLLPEETEALVSILGYVEIALEWSLDSQYRSDVRQHCGRALRLIEAIEYRHPDGDLPEDVAACISKVRREVRRAIERLDDPALAQASSQAN